jgi:hypothetical protein
VENLPEGSAIRADIAGGDEFRPWDTKTYLLANIFNAINSNTLVLSNAPKSMRNKVHPITGPERDNAADAEKRRAVGAFLRKFNIIK